MRIYNTLSEQKEELKKSRKPVKMFVCGPTVYDQAHVGHARVEIVFDIVARYLRERGFKMQYVQNITDVDDKIVARALADKTTPQKIARQFEHEYLKDMKAIRATSVDRRVRASNYITEIRKQIQRLIIKGYAYTISSGVYFEVRGFADYGKLSKQDLDEARPGWRIEKDPEKKDPLDFALWKISKSPNEIGWSSPWGRGRPGWHIEDTAITEKILGQQYDIHGGGLDLKFPHHESEIAQQEAASGKKPFVKIWMHVGMIMVEGEKMSKSLNNFITIDDFLKKYPVNVLRFMMVSAHYRSPLNYSSQLADQAASALATIEEFLHKIDFIAVTVKTKALSAVKAATALAPHEREFIASMNDDFSMPAALAALFRLINNYQERLWELDRSEALAIRALLIKKLSLFGLLFKRYAIPASVKALTAKREALRIERKFNEADTVRTKIEEAGYIIEDTPLGPLIKTLNLNSNGENTAA